MEATGKLASCIAYSLRCAQKAGLEEVADLLWRALFHAAQCRGPRQPICLYSALGLDVEQQDFGPVCSPAQEDLGTFVNMATQTVEEVFSSDECRRITEGLVGSLMAKAHDAIQVLSDRIQSLEGTEVTDTGSVRENVPATEQASKWSDKGITVPEPPESGRQSARVPESSVFCSDINQTSCVSSVPSSSDMNLPLPASSVSSNVSLPFAQPEYLEQLREAHMLRRRALKEQKRRERRM